MRVVARGLRARARRRRRARGCACRSCRSAGSPCRLLPARAARVHRRPAAGRRIESPGPFDEEEPWGSERISRGASGASTTPGSRWRTAHGWPRASGCRTTPRPTRSRRSSSTCRTARATRWPAATPRHHPYFAGHGYAAVRVDLRGTRRLRRHPRSTSTRRQEEDDALEVLAWLAAQPWCTGRVGMFGISWGGFNGLQVAARRPAGAPGRHLDVRERRPLRRRRPLHRRLRARARHAPVGRDDADAARPAARPGRRSATAGASTWFARMERTPAFVEPWLAPPAPRRLLAPRLGLRGLRARSQAPVYAIGGWADGYTNAVPRLLAGLPGPRKGLIGPWSHAFPQDGDARPGDRLPPGVPALVGPLAQGRRHRRSWTSRCSAPGCRSPSRPAGLHAERPGRWVAEAAWPSPEIEARRLALGAAARSGERARRPRRRSHHSPETAGPGRGRLVRRRRRGRLARSTSAPRTAARSTFTSAPLDERVEVARLPRGRRSSSRPTGRGRSSRSGCATSRPTARRCSSPAACSTSPIATGHAEPVAARARPPLPGHRAPRRDRARRSPPGTGCASRSRRRTGRGSGRRRSR